MGQEKSMQGGGKDPILQPRPTPLPSLPSFIIKGKPIRQRLQAWGMVLAKLSLGKRLTTKYGYRWFRGSSQNLIMFGGQTWLSKVWFRRLTSLMVDGLMMKSPRFRKWHHRILRKLSHNAHKLEKIQNLRRLKPSQIYLFSLINPQILKFNFKR